MKPITPELMKQFLKQAGENLEGDWVLVGGSFLLFLDISDRATTDIDLVPLNEKQSTSQTLQLMKIAESLNLSVESINTAASFFLYQIKDYKKKLELLHKSENGKVSFYGPNLELYVELKLNRLSETDYQDCLSYIKYVKKKTPKNIQAIKNLIEKKQKNSKDLQEIEKLKDLLKALG